MKVIKIIKITRKIVIVILTAIFTVFVANLLFVRANILLPVEKQFYEMAALQLSNNTQEIPLSVITNFVWDEVCAYPNVDTSMTTGIDEFLLAWGELEKWKAKKFFWETPLFLFNKQYTNVLFFKNRKELVRIIRTNDKIVGNGDLRFSASLDNFCSPKDNVYILRSANKIELGRKI